MTTMTIPIPARLILTANQRLHWTRRAAVTRELRQLAVSAWGAAGGPRMDRAHLTVTITYPDRRRRDIANLHPTVKALVDGMVSAGLLPDDNDGCLLGPDLRRNADVVAGPGRFVFEVTVEPIEGDLL